MPDLEGEQKGEPTSTPLHAYKDGREEDLLADPEATEEGHPEASEKQSGGDQRSGEASTDEPAFGRPGDEGSGDDPSAPSGGGDQGLGGKTGAIEGEARGGGPGGGREGRDQ